VDKKSFMVSESVLDIVLLFLYNSFDELKIELLNRCHGRVTLADSLERAILKQGGVWWKASGGT
jgi:hypothetical protein